MLAYHRQLRSRFRECHANAPNPNYGFSVFPASTPYMFVWTRNSFLCVCSRCWKEAAHCAYCLELAGFSYSEKLLGLPRELRKAVESSPCWFSWKQVGLCCYSSEIGHAKCSQSALSTWLTSKVVCQCGYQEDIYMTTYKLCRCTCESLKSWRDTSRLPAEPEEHVALPLMHGKRLATFLLVREGVVKNDIWGIFCKNIWWILNLKNISLYTPN